MFSKIVFGGGAFNTQYNKDPALKDVAAVIKHAFDNGVTTLDTAAYYGPSEDILGQALRQIKYDRSKYQICSKACRWEDNSFDYSAESVNKSVQRSLKRLGTEYLDVLYIHDAEFTTPNDVLTAIKAAFDLKTQGLVRNVGVSGYPLPVLVKVAKMVNAELGKPLDCVLSYCNLTLQNNLLLDATAEFEAAGVKHILNASPLSMSLLRNEPTHDFHPASPELRAKADAIGAKYPGEYADLALQYAFNAWQPRSTVLGLRTIEEIDAALRNLKLAVESPQTDKWSEIISDFGNLHNQLWEEEKPQQFKQAWADLKY